MFEVVDGRAIVLDLKTSKYFSLNPTASRMFVLVEKHGDLDEVIQILDKEFSAPKDRIAEDLAAFVADLRERDLVRAERHET